MIGGVESATISAVRMREQDMTVDVHSNCVPSGPEGWGQDS